PTPQVEFSSDRHDPATDLSREARPAPPSTLRCALSNILPCRGLAKLRANKHKAKTIYRSAVARFLTDGRRQHHDLGADARAIVELDDVLVGHSNAARGNALADGPRLVGAVDPVKGVLVALPKIQGAGAERILRTAGHAEAAAQLDHRRSDLGPARDA